MSENPMEKLDALFDMKQRVLKEIMKDDGGCGWKQLCIAAS